MSGTDAFVSGHWSPHCCDQSDPDQTCSNYSPFLRIERPHLFQEYPRSPAHLHVQLIWDGAWFLRKTGLWLSVFGSCDRMMTWCFDSSLSVIRHSHDAFQKLSHDTERAEQWVILQPGCEDQSWTLNSIHSLRPVMVQQSHHQQSALCSPHRFCGLKRICFAFAPVLGRLLSSYFNR